MNKWYICLLALLLAACSSDETPVPDKPVIPGPEKEEEGGTASLTLTLAFPTGETTRATRALTETQERRIDKLRIFVFESAGGTDNQLNDKFLYEVENVPVPSGSGDTKTATITVRKMPQKQRFVLVANLPAATTLNPTAGQTMNALFTNINFPGANWRKEGIAASDPAFPMWGQMRDSTLIFGSTVPTGITVNMFRTLARIDVGVDMDNTTSTLANNFKIQNVYVCNTGSSTYLTPHADYMKGTGIAQTVFSKTHPHSTRYAQQAYAVSNQRTLTNAIYIPESDIPGSGNTPAFLVVQATYKGTANCYYRIDFAKDGDFIPVVRNHAYRFNIKSVNSNGYASLDDAKNADPSGLGNDIIVEGVNSNINEIVYNDNDMLGVSVSELLFDWDTPLVGKATASSAKNEYTMKLLTTYAGWTATIQSPPAWLRLLEGTTEKTTITGTQTAGQQSSFGIRVKSENLTGTEREATILLKAGMLEIPIRVRQSGGANSHLIRFGASASSATIKLPIPFGRAALGGTLSLTGVRAKVLWQESTESIPVTFTAALDGTNYVNVTASSTGNTQYGNAVVALVSGSGIGYVGANDPEVIIWSWHLWCMPASADADANFHDPNTDAFMYTTMGRYASNKGMFYQWGRKDPFPQSPTNVSPRTVVTAATTASNTQAYVIKHPTVFYTSATTWLSSAVGALWTNLSKAEYRDPCPTGWRVPSSTEKPEWTAASTLANGYIIGTTGAHSGTAQHAWITPGSSGSYLYWSGTGLTQTTATNAAEGRPVRCIKDINLVR